jgi:hypothetical protein
MFNAQAFVCECNNGARKFTLHALIMYLENKLVTTHIMQVWIYKACYEWVRASGFCEGRGPTWPFGTHHVDGGV